MKNEQEIIEKAATVFIDEDKYCDTPEIEWDGKTLKVSRMYDPIRFNFGMAKEMLDFLGAKDIVHDSFAHPGCGTCDFGSSYGVELTFIF